MTMVRTGLVHSPFDLHVAVQPFAQYAVFPRSRQAGPGQEGSKGGSQVFLIQDGYPPGSSSC